MNDDGHSPATCNYTRCDSESDVPCPFVKDAGLDQVRPNQYADYSYLDKPQRSIGPKFMNKLKADAHEHRYTVPVEAEYDYPIRRGEGRQTQRSLPAQNAIPDLTLNPYGWYVTKLRCETCPSEIARGEESQ